MRWPFGPPHLTLKPSKKKPNQKKNKQKKQTKKQKKEKKKAPKKKQQKYQKIAFQLSVNFSFFWVLFKISLFWHIGPESLHPKNTRKIGVSGPFFLKAVVCHETAVFGPKNPKFINFSYHFFAYFFSFNNKKPKTCWNPYFYSVFRQT